MEPDKVAVVHLGIPFKDYSVAKCQTEVSAEGFDIIRLCNSRLSVTVMPQLGGKIYEIIDLRSGRDWLWKNPHITLRHPSPGMDYNRDLDSGGWDEILFSINPCELELADGSRIFLGDHGNAVDKAWTCVETHVNTAGEAVCDLVTGGTSPHFKLQRRIVLAEEQPGLMIEYKLSNTGLIPWPWLWCAHPLLAIEEGMRINLDGGQQIRQAHDDVSGPPTHSAWPTLVSPDGRAIDLAGIFDNSNEPGRFCQKLFVRSARQVSISTAGGVESFKIIYDPEALPWLGLWVNKNAWSGCGSEPYLNLGIEPATTPHDSLTEAVKQGQVDFLQSGESKEWSLTISLGNTVNE